MGYGFSDDRFHNLATPADLAHEHGALDCGYAKVSHAIFIGGSGQPALRFLSDEESGELVFHNLEDQAEVLAYQLIVFGHFVPDGSEGTTSRHTGALLQFDLRKQPAFQILPSGNFVLEARGAGLDGFQMGLQDFVNQAFLALEIVIELALPGARGFNDLVRAGGANPLLVKQVSGSPNDAKPGFRAPHKSRFHRLPLLVPVSTIVNGLFVESGRPLGSILYLISVS